MEEFIKILKALFSGFFMGLIISIPLGPSGIESVKRTMSQGYKQGFLVSIGALCADVSYLLLINCGLSNILDRNKKTEAFFWIISGTILILISFFSIKNENINKHAKFKSLTINCITSLPFLSGFFITFFNPMTPSLWITLSGTVIRAWYYVNITCYYVFVLFTLVGMICWFAILNYLALKGINILTPKASKKTSSVLMFSIGAIGAIFVVFGFINLITLL